MENTTPVRRSALYKLLAYGYHQLSHFYNETIRRHYQHSVFRELARLFSKLFSIVFLHPFVKVFILMVQTLWLIILLLFLTYLPLSSMDQATDVFRVISTGKPIDWAICAHLAVFAFALTVWFSCRMLFILFDFNKIKYRIYGDETLTKAQENGIQEMMRWIPPLLGLVPFLLFVQGLSGQEGGGVQTVLICLWITLYFWLLSLNSQFLKPAAQVSAHQPKPGNDDDVPDNEASDYLSLQNHSFTQLRVRYRLLTYFLYACCLALFLICAYPPANLWFSRTIGVVAGLFLAMSMWVFLAQALLLLDHQYKAPIAILILGVILFFWNTNNHQIRTLGESYFEKGKLGNRGIAQHFVRWVTSRQDKIAAWTSDSAHTSRYPVYIIAAEGGGLRASYWTSAVLGELSRRIPHFYDRVYALSTVSGGSVGATVYTALYADSLRRRAQGRGLRTPVTVNNNAKEILKQDYLSPLTMAFLVPDMLQKLAPVGIAAFDRARYLEDALSTEYRTVARQNLTNEAGSSLDSSFMSLWAGDQLYRVPSLFLNCTRVENGAKAVLSNLLIDGESFNGVNRQEVIDLQELIHRNVRISTAAFMSARFPIVTPPATVQHTDAQRSDRSNFVDGGYIDNSGLETAIAVLTSIRQAFDAVPAVFGRDTTATQKARNALSQVEVHLILIKNSEQNDDEPAPVRGLYELKAPLLAFVNSWDRHIGSKLNVARSYLRLAAAESKADPKKIPVDPTLVLFDVDRKQELVPLGWYLSKTAQFCMDRQADSLSKLETYRQYINWNLRHLRSADPLLVTSQ